MSDRNTQFQGFAKALWDELCSNFGSWYEFDNDNTHNESQEIIAHRAYDLVKHSVSETIGSSDITHVPDLTELPKER